MSLYFMEHGKPEVRKYTKHGRTKQSYKDSCDINKLLEKGAKQGGLSHIERHGAKYGDFAAIDWEQVPLQLAEGRQVFSELPAEIKREFNQSPGEFYEFVTNPENTNRIKELLPAIAERGNFFPRPNVVQTRGPEMASEEPTMDSTPTPDGEGDTTAEAE